MKVKYAQKTKDFVIQQNLTKKFNKQIGFIESVGLNYPSLNFEVVEGTRHREAKVYSFRVDKAYRAYFIMPDENTVRIILVDKHKYPFK